jgi:hypothetical protein
MQSPLPTKWTKDWQNCKWPNSESEGRTKRSRQSTWTDLMTKCIVLGEEGKYSHIGIQRLSWKLLSSGCRLMLVAGKAGQSILSVDKLVHMLEGWRSEPGWKPPFLGSSKVAEELIQRWTNANAANADNQVSQAAIDGDVVRPTLLFCFHTHHSLHAMLFS